MRFETKVEISTDSDIVVLDCCVTVVSGTIISVKLSRGTDSIIMTESIFINLFPGGDDITISAYEAEAKERQDRCTQA